MACGCGKPVQREMIRAAVSRAGASGAYPLFNYPECTTLHTGKYAGDSVFVVARGRHEERMFTRKQLQAASDYSKGVTNAVIEAIPTSGLCDEAVLALFD